MDNMIPQNIVLEKCPACGGVVSPSAEACPHCGHPIGQLKRQALKEQRKQEVAAYARSVADKSKPVAKKFAGVVFKAILYLLALFGLALCVGAVGLISKAIFPAPGFFFVNLVMWPGIFVLPAIALAEKLFGLMPGFIIGRLLLIFLGISGIGVCSQLKEYYYWANIYGNRPETSLSIAYGVSACIVIGWLVKVWNRTSETKNDLEYYRRKRTNEQTEPGHDLRRD